MSEENYTNEGNYTEDTSTSFTDSSFNTPVDSQPEGGKGLAIASMVLGIVSIIMLCCTYWISIPCAIVGLVLGIVNNKKNGKNGMATAGIVCSIISIVLAVLLIVFAMAIVGAVGGAAGLNEILNEMQQYQ